MQPATAFNYGTLALDCYSSRGLLYSCFEEYQYLVPLVPVTDYYKKTPLEA